MLKLTRRHPRDPAWISDPSMASPSFRTAPDGPDGATLASLPPCESSQVRKATPGLLPVRLLFKQMPYVTHRETSSLKRTSSLVYPPLAGADAYLPLAPSLIRRGLGSPVFPLLTKERVRSAHFPPPYEGGGSGEVAFRRATACSMLVRTPSRFSTISRFVNRRTSIPKRSR